MSLPLDEDISHIQGMLGPRPGTFGEITCVAVRANGLGRREIGQYWDNIALTGAERDVLDALRIIQRDARAITLIVDPESQRGDRIPIVQVGDGDAPMPLRHMGEGMVRIFGIAVALANAKGGLLLIDEVESGLHYSVFSDLWHVIFETARRLEVQVFATTHSWECISGFQEAANEDREANGFLVRLDKTHRGDIAPTIFDVSELGIATREQIEVR